MTVGTSSSTDAAEVPKIGDSRQLALKILRDVLVRSLPKRFREMANRFCQKGTSKATAIKLKCLECSCGVSTEVTHCPVVACPLWPVRPFQVEEINRNTLAGYRIH